MKLKKWYRTGTSHLHTLNPVQERLAQSLLYPSQQIPVLDATYSLLLRFRYLFTLHHSVAQNQEPLTEPIRYKTLHFRDLRGASLLLCNRNRTEITPFLSVKKPYQVYQQYGLHAGARASILYSVSIAQRSNLRSHPLWL